MVFCHPLLTDQPINSDVWFTLWLFCHTIYVSPPKKKKTPLCILSLLSQRSSHPSVDQTLRLFCFFCHIICLQFEAKNPIILSAFPVMPPSAFTSSLIGSNPQITPAPFVRSSIFTLKNPIIAPCLHPPWLHPGRSSHPSLANSNHSSSPGVGGLVV